MLILRISYDFVNCVIVRVKFTRFCMYLVQVILAVKCPCTIGCALCWNKMLCITSGIVVLVENCYTVVVRCGRLVGLK